MRRNQIRKKILELYKDDLVSIQKLINYTEENIEVLNKYADLYPVIGEHGGVFLKYIPSIESYLEFEQGLIAVSAINKSSVIENRKKYNVTESDLIEFYGYNYPFGGKKNNKQKRKVKERFSREEVMEQLELFNKIFDANDDAYINIRCRKTGEYYAYNIKSLLDQEKLYNVLNSSRFSTNEDLMYSLNLFNNMKNLSTENIFTLFSIAVDVDFKETRKYVGKKPKDIIKILEKYEFGINIPTPNVIEYGNNLRLIYTFDKVYSTKAANGLANRIARIIGERLADYKGKGQPITTYGRIVNSMNSRNNAKVKVMYQLDVNKYTLSKLKEFTAPLEEWHPEPKVRTGRKVIDLGNNFAKTARYRNNNLNRIEDFFKIQEHYNFDCDGRRFMCYQVRNHAIIAGYSKEEAKELMRDFNNRFRYPLRWNVIERDTRNVERKQYYYRSETILNHIGIDADEEVVLNLKGMISETEHKRRDNEANKQRQKAKYRDESGLTRTELARRNQFILIARMELQGLTYKAIAQELGYKDHTPVIKKVNRVYNKINYTEILAEVKNGQYADVEVAIR